MIKIVLAEDHHIVRHGLRLLLEQESDIQLVGEAADGLETVKLVAKTRPDVLVLDLMIPRMHGLEVARQLGSDAPDTKIIILSMHAEEHYVMEALRYGAAGYVLKDSTGDSLVKAVREVVGGRRYLSPVLADIALTGYLSRPGESLQDVYETLTKRERLVLQLSAEGMTASDIAAKLYISPRTAETHRANLMRKLDLHSQTDLVRFAIRKGVIAA